MNDAVAIERAAAQQLALPRRTEAFASVGRRLGSGWILPAITLVVWEVGSRLGALPRNWLPAPSDVVLTLIALSKDGALLQHVLATLLRLMLGFGLGAALGSVFGILTGRSARLRSLLDPSLQALRSIPSLAWVPLFLLWLGIGETSKVVLIAVGVFFPVYLNLMGGVLAIDGRLVEVGQLHGLHGWGLARRVLIPATLPAYLTGLRSGLGLGWMFVVAAELMGASRGLGYLLVDGQTTSRPELVIGAIVMFASLGKLTDWGLERVSARAQAWRRA
jgi:sulfonate transport system permease protein